MQYNYILTCVTVRSHYPERASAIDFKDTAYQRFGHSDVAFDLFIETLFLHLITLLSSFSNLSLYVKSITNSVYLAFVLMIDRQYFEMFFITNRQNYISMTKSRSQGVFELWGRCSLRVMTPGSYSWTPQGHSSVNSQFHINFNVWLEVKTATSSILVNHKCW